MPQGEHAPVDYDGRQFRALTNSEAGEVSDGTLFRYRQDGEVVWADYDGGGIRRGHLLGLVAPGGDLDFRYHHVAADGSLRTGECRTRLERLPDGRYRLHENWQWSCGGRESGTSILEEVGDAE